MAGVKANDSLCTPKWLATPFPVFTFLRNMAPLPSSAGCRGNHRIRCAFQWKYLNHGALTLTISCPRLLRLVAGFQNDPPYFNCSISWLCCLGTLPDTIFHSAAPIATILPSPSPQLRSDSSPGQSQNGCFPDPSFFETCTLLSK